MGKEYTFQHYVPRTYLESWENKEGRLTVYKKGTTSCFLKSTDSVLGENDYYTLKAGDYITLSELDRKFIFGELKSYNIHLEGEPLYSVEDFMFNFNRFDDWDIMQKNGNKVDKQLLKKTINQKRILDIEKNWQTIEIEWRNVREEICKALDDNSYNLSMESGEKLIAFMAAQKSRNNTKKHEYREMVDPILDFLKEDMEEKIYNDMIDDFSEAYFLKEARRFQAGDSSSLTLKEQKLMENLHIVIYKAVSGRKFLTSDNPVFTIFDSQFYKGKYSGLYFPITPEVVVALFRGDRYSYSKNVMPANMMRRFNHRVIENSDKFYVRKED